MERNTHPLRRWREQYNLSMEALAKGAGLSERTILRAEQGRFIYPSSRQLITQYFTGLAERTVTSHELGLLTTDEERGQERLEITTMDTLRRELFKKTLQFTVALLALPTPMDVDRLATVFTKPESLDTSTLQDIEKLLKTLWEMSNTSETLKVERTLSTYLPSLVTLAHQPTKYQRRAAHLASQAYILSAEVDRGNVNAMKAFCQQAVLYGEIAENNDIQVASLKQQATIFLVDKQPQKALECYQKTLPRLRQVTPLLRSRVYLGLASASARCYQKEDALTYLGLARESFPRYPEDDPNYLTTICSIPVLHLYETLTYTDLQQSDAAWNALVKVDGLHPKMPISESTRIEFLNLQAKTAAYLGDMERSEVYLHASIEAASASGYTVWLEEAHEVYSMLLTLWPNERKVKEMASLFQSFRG